jgi:molybdopterin converting factor small subunit
MRLTVQYHGQARAAIGNGEETIEIDSPCAIAQLLLRVAELHPELRKVVLDGDGRPHPSLLTFVGDRMVRVDSSQSLRDGDVVSMHAPIFGG